MSRFLKSMIIGWASLSLCGCATIVSGTTQKLNVTTQPSEAIAKVDNNLSSKTPAVFTLERKYDHTIEISKEGYKTATVLIKRTFNGMATGNILIGGIIGGGIDAASGAGQKLIPERVDIVLEEGTGYSDVPKFRAKKDADFYENSILKKEKDKAQPVIHKDAVASPPATITNFSSAPAHA